MELGHILGSLSVPAMAGILPNIGRALPLNGADHDGDKVESDFFLGFHPMIIWLVVGTPLKKYESVGSIYIWNSQYVRSHQIPWFQTTNQLLMINSCWYHRWGCWWLPEIGEKSTASESASIPTSGICECSSTSTSLWNHIETTSKPHWNYHSTCIVSEVFFGHVDDVLWLHLQHLHPARFFV